jgi:hypothetical protein
MNAAMARMAAMTMTNKAYFAFMPVPFIHDAAYVKIYLERS